MQQVYIDQVFFPSFYNLNAKCKGHENKEGKKTEDPFDLPCTYQANENDKMLILGLC